MPVIIITADSYEKGREIGQQTAEVLGYRYVDRELLGRVSEVCKTPEERLVRLLEDAAPAPLGGVFSKRWREQVACIQQEVLQRLLEDNVVCHGLCAHLYVLGVSHVIRVRLISRGADAGGQPAVACDADVEEDAARLQKQWRCWSLRADDQEQTYLCRYDLVVNLDAADMPQVVEKLAEAAADPKFRANTYSLNCLRDLELAARVRVRLMQQFPNVDVEANAATVVVRAKLSRRSRNRQIETIKKLVREMPGVAYVEVHPVSALLPKTTP